MKKILYSFLLCLLNGAPLHSNEEAHTVATQYKTKTPIKHLVVIIPGNSSFDHVFATYPKAENLPGEPCFTAKKNTPSVNGLSDPLLKHNCNLFQPFRLTRAEINTNEPVHHYTQQQELAHGGLLDQFVQVNLGDNTPMGYFDGNTITCLWNYAQRFAMSDNCFSTTMSSATPGHINIISGLTYGALPDHLTSSNGNLAVVEKTLVGDADPAFDVCSNEPKVELTGKNIGDLLNAKNITWGYFQGGFKNSSKSHINSRSISVVDYIPSHQPFQYYLSTANPNHTPPSSVEMIGHQDQANHQYDISDFWAAIKNGQIPSVSFIKPAAYQDGHPRYSDPLALQFFLVHLINRLQKSVQWQEMAIVIVWDGSGGWYDHVMPPIINQSRTVADALLAPGDAGYPQSQAYQGRLAYGFRVPLLVISPFAKSNYVDHSVIDQTSVLRFIEDNWHLGRIGQTSFDAVAATLEKMFDFRNSDAEVLLLNPNSGLRKKPHDL